MSTSSSNTGGETNSVTTSQASVVHPDPSSLSTAYAAFYSNSEYNAQLQQYYQQYYANSHAQQLTYGYDQQQYAAYYAALATSGDTSASYNAAYANTPYCATTSAISANANEVEDENEDEEEEDDDDPTVVKPNKKASNTLPYHCNEKMGLNPLIFTNIQQSPYFKNNLFQLKTYHEVIDEIYYNVKHLEPWEKGSRKVSGQTGMCGSVRGVGAGGIISTPFCLLFKLFTLRLTRKQVNGLIRHKDSPFIRGLGFMYIRYTQPPQDLWQWFEPYLEDEGQVDPKAGGGALMTIGQMVRQLLTKLDWFSTLFPRIPIPIQKDIDEKLRKYDLESSKQKKSFRESRKSRETEDEPEAKSRSDRSHRHHRTDYSKNGAESYSRRSRSRSKSPTYDNYKYNRHKSRERKNDDYRHHSRRH